MKIAAIGRSKFLYDTILKLIDNKYKITCIITDNASQGYNISSGDFEKLAIKYNIKFLKTSKINSLETINFIKEQNSDIAVSVNWKTIIGDKIINLFKYGILNAHAGDLPKYKGNAVPNWAILNNENQVVLTIHKMIANLDAGDIMLQKKIEISKDTYISHIYDFLKKEIPNSFTEVINKIDKKEILPKAQSKDPKDSLRCYPRNPEDGLINWNLDGEYLSRLVRASGEPFKGAYTFFNNEKLIIWKAHFEKPKSPFCGIPSQVAERRIYNGEVVVITSNGFLVLEEIEYLNSGKSKPTDIIKSIRTRLGYNYILEINKLKKEILELKSKNLDK